MDAPHEKESVADTDNNSSQSMDAPHEKEDVADTVPDSSGHDVVAKGTSRRSDRKRQVTPTKKASKGVSKSTTRKVGKKVSKKVNKNDSPTSSTTTDSDTSGRSSTKRKASDIEADTKGPMTRARKKRLSDSSVESAEVALP